MENVVRFYSTMTLEMRGQIYAQTPAVDLDQDETMEKRNFL